MIDVYTWPTPNGHKVHIMLEECGLRLGRDWRVHPVNIGQGDQFRPEFLTISPNNKIPALVDPVGPDGKPISLFESGAILMYLAEKTGRFCDGIITVGAPGEKLETVFKRFAKGAREAGKDPATMPRILQLHLSWAATDEEALAAFHLLARTEGILPALESSHAIAQAIKLARELPKDGIVLCNLSGRGDKDVQTIAGLEGFTL